MGQIRENTKPDETLHCMSLFVPSIDIIWKKVAL